MQLTEPFSIAAVSVSTKSEVYLQDFFIKFEDVGK